MSTHKLVRDLAIEGPDGQYVALQVPGRRAVATVEGLVGLVTRERIRARPGRHGIINTSKYRDSPPVVIEGELFGDDADDAWTEYNALAIACAAAVDTDRGLRWTGGTVLDLVEQKVRVAELSPPIVVAEDVIRYRLTLRPADPRSFAQDIVIVAGPNVEGAVGGKSYPYSYPRQYAQPGTSDALFTVAGTDKTPPVLRVYGLCANPKLELLSTGAIVQINGTVNAGHWLDVDVAAREVRLDDGTVRNDVFDFEASTWFDLPPGPQTVRLTATSVDSNAHVEARFYPAYA